MTPEARVIETLFNISNKRGERVPFKLNGDQSRYDENRTKRDIIPKARQRGFSSLGIGYQTVDCLGKEGTRAVLISHEAKATQRLLDKARYYLQYINGPQPELGRHSRNEFYFPKTESTYYIGTAGAKAFGRGDTITHLHISEYAWWESDALKQVAGLFQAVPLTGTIRIESTGNGRNNDFYYMVSHAEMLGYKVHFCPWWDNNEYQLPPAEGWVPEGFENYFQDMKVRYNLSDAQLFWYWIKLLEFRMDLAYMKQEYPSELEECFQATGGAVFTDVSRVKSEYWQWRLERFKDDQGNDLLDQGVRCEYHEEHPKPGKTYIIGADPSGGTGNDEAGIQIFCIESFEQVYELGSNVIDPVELGHILSILGRCYNEAYIVAESNHHGIATHSVLLRLYPRMKVYKRRIPMRATSPDGLKYGFITTDNTKPQLIGAIKECIEFGLVVYGLKTIKQMIEFEEDENGKMGGPEDGLVISLGMACVGLMKYKRFIIQEEPRIEDNRAYRQELLKNYKFEVTFDDIFRGIKKPQSGPFRRQLN